MSIKLIDIWRADC